MANGDAFDDAVKLAAQTPTLDIGCHLVLVQGRSLLSGKELPATPVRLLCALAAGEIEPYRELRAQIEKISAAGITPSHLDTHKHTHLVPSVFGAVVRLAREFQIPFVRLLIGPLDSLARAYARPRGVQTTDHFTGFRLTGKLNESSFLRALQSLPEGTTEFMCHPGFLMEDLQGAPTRLKHERVSELEALISPHARDVLNAAKVELTSFRDLASQHRA